MTKNPKPDLSEYEEEAVPFDEVMQKLAAAKSAPKKPNPKKEPSDADEKP